jgi:UDP-glucose 4-epimerase
MKCLVTGGAGFIGSNLVDKLVKMGYNIIVIDNECSRSHEHFYWNKRAENYKLDIRNYSEIEPLFKDVDFVFHMAAESSIPASIKNPTLTMQTNIIGTCNVLEASRKNGVTRVMYSSTSAAYGLKNTPPMKEDMKRDCLNPYSVSKTSGEDLCKMYTDLFDLKTITFRYFNVYGQRQPVKGQYAPVIGIFLRQKEEGVPMTIVGDGLQTRDYIHVNDVVEANILATTCKAGFGEVFNIGTGIQYSVLDLVKAIGGEFIHLPPRIGEARVSFADNSKSQKMLNWVPKIDLKKWLLENKGDKEC